MTEGYPSNWERLRKEVYERDNFTCQNCGSLGGQKGNTELHAHHVVPKAKGGGHHLSNLKTLCKSCHNAVHGGESVQGHVQNQSSGLEGILHFPDLAETMEYYTGATPSQEIGICLSEQSPGFSIHYWICLGKTSHRRTYLLLSGLRYPRIAYPGKHKRRP